MNLHWLQDEPGPAPTTPAGGEGGIGGDTGGAGGGETVRGDSAPPQRFAGDVPLGKGTDEGGPARTREEVFRREHDALVKGSAEVQDIKSRERATRTFIESEVERLAPRKAAIEQAKAGRAGAAAQRKSDAASRTSAFREEQKALVEERKGREAQRRADEEKKLDEHREELKQRQAAQRGDSAGLTVQQKTAQARVVHQATQFITKAREDVKNRIHTLDRTISTSDSRRKEITNQLKELQRDVTKTERAVKTEKKDIDRVQHELRDIQSQRREVMTETGKKTRKDIATEVSKLDRQRFKLENEVRTLERFVSRDARVDQRSSQDLNTLKRELRELEAKTPRLELEFRELSDLMREIERARFGKDPISALQKLNYELEKQGIHMPGVANIRPAT